MVRIPRILTKKTNEMKRLKEIFENMAANHRRSRQERRRRTLERMAREAIQVRDHNGKLYVCLDGVPVLSADEANGDLLDMVRAMRVNYVVWHEEGGQA